MKSTRIIIYALTAKGKKALAIGKADEIALRETYKNVRSWKIPFRLRSYLKTVSLFIPKHGDPERHEILGFRRMGEITKQQFYLGVKQSFKENGCSLKDFEVKFYDDK